MSRSENRCCKCGQDIDDQMRKADQDIDRVLTWIAWLTAPLGAALLWGLVNAIFFRGY